MSKIQLKEPLSFWVQTQPANYTEVLLYDTVSKELAVDKDKMQYARAHKSNLKF